MTDATALGAPARESSNGFYSWIAIACLAIAVVGFTPTYFGGMVRGQFSAPPIVHIHGMILFAWVAFFCIQTRLVAQGATLAHRTWGMFGIAIMTAMACTTLAVVSLRIAQAELPGQPAGAAHAVKAFAWISISGLLFIVGSFAIAIAKIKRPEVHKRLMLLLTVSMLGAPIARWFIFFLAPPFDPTAVLPNGVAIATAPPAVFSILPALIGDLLLVAAMIFDRRTQGRIHPTYLIGGMVMLIIQVTVGLVADSSIWQAAATAIGHLAG